MQKIGDILKLFTFFCLYGNYPSKKDFTLNEARITNLKADKRTLKCQPFLGVQSVQLYYIPNISLQIAG